MAVACRPTMPPPIILGLKPISLTARTMPTEVGRIGAHHHDIRIGRLDRAHDRREVGRATADSCGRRRSAGRAALAFSRAPSAALRENSWSAATIATVCGFGFCCIAMSKKPLVKAGFASGPDGIITK